jgi:hypothetical protein
MVVIVGVITHFLAPILTFDLTFVFSSVVVVVVENSNFGLSCMLFRVLTTTQPANPVSRYLLFHDTGCYKHHTLPLIS